MRQCVFLLSRYRIGHCVCTNVIALPLFCSIAPRGTQHLESAPRLPSSSHQALRREQEREVKVQLVVACCARLAVVVVVPPGEEATGGPGGFFFRWPPPSSIAEMSDGEDDFMCEEEEDYGLVSRLLVLYFANPVCVFPPPGVCRLCPEWAWVFAKP